MARALKDTSDADVVSAARDAAARGDSLEAATALRASRDRLRADDLEVLAESEWWLGNLNECIEVRQEAYQRQLAEGQPEKAAALALKLAADHESRNAPSQAQGWLRRATRLLKDLPEGPVHGRLLLRQIWNRYRRDDPAEAIGVATRASEIAGRHDDVDLQALSMMELGRVLIHSGRADDAMPLIEEACAAAVGGELSRYTTGTVFCEAIVTFQDLTDYGRAGEWADAATRWCERRSLKGFPGLCRIHRAEVMRLRGAWAEASVQAERACAELAAFAPGLARGAFRELAIVRLRLGDVAGAESAVAEARALGSTGQPSLAMVYLAKGSPQVAVAGLREVLAADDWSDLERAPLLSVMVEAALGANDETTAVSAASELGSTAERYGRPVLRAAAAEAAGRVEIARGDGAAAVTLLRIAQRDYAALDLPYECSRARLLLARAHELAGSAALARQEIETALQTFNRLGAVTDAEAAVVELAKLTAPHQQHAVFMFTDIVRSTPLVEALGDDAWTDLVNWHDGTLRGLFAQFGGEELDHAGDGFFVAFGDAKSAVACAMAIQRTLRTHRREHGFAPDVRIGLHADIAARSGRQLRGRGVHVAARIGALASGGEILISVEMLGEVGEGTPIDRRRTVELKGLKGSFDVASIRWVSPNA